MLILCHLPKRIQNVTLQMILKIGPRESQGDCSIKTIFFTVLTFLLTNRKTKAYIMTKFKLCIKTKKRKIRKTKKIRKNKGVFWRHGRW